MLKIFNKFLSFFSKKDLIENTNENKSDSSFYINVVCKGKEKMDADLFDKNSPSFLFRERV